MLDEKIMRFILMLVFLTHKQAAGRFPLCHFSWEMKKASQECHAGLEHLAVPSAGCVGEWDNASCWRSAAVGEVVSQPCPAPLLHLFGKKGNLSRKCTPQGWSDVYPVIAAACSSNDTDQPGELVFYKVVMVLSTLGHSLSLISLLSSTVIIAVFRRLHCMRNYIHINLFASFMLRGVAVLTKDLLLFSSEEEDTPDCSAQPSLVGCKSSLVFLNYSIMANFFWLLVEALYLHTLLLVVHARWARLSVYMLIGWGIPSVFTVAWILCRLYLDNTWCWERNDSPVPSRVLDWPILACVVVNFILFISIIRILVQKLRCTNVGGNEQSQYKRLAKSTLLLIPLFGINYVVFVHLMEPSDKTTRHVKIFFELGLGSFQGLVVAVLYCFLNCEVQSELRRMRRSLSLKRYMGGGERGLRAASLAPEHSAPFPRNSRAASILQTETLLL
ncbi:vasoactive intestinal polypeptide receptor 2 isoform X1 [Syngnathus typhle]|uniref:vasoactive intestinal polypeptide receptor 2 isoform X1 n=1 Tax=Syngnathus typhle TaxID=161592 RepID=UPI002A6A7C90|nr:vasoactive intestinal polypeptide receptor 2 isoform X1 [Syngnathus typhle]